MLNELPTRDEVITYLPQWFEDRASGRTATTEEIRWPAKWRKQKLRMLRELSKLQANWDSYNAYPIDHDAIYCAINRLNEIALMTTAEPLVSASPSGTPLLVWHDKDGDPTLELEFLPDGSINYFATDPRGLSEDIEEIVTCLGDVAHLIPGT